MDSSHVLAHSRQQLFCFTMKNYSLFKTKLPSTPDTGLRRSDMPVQGTRHGKTSKILPATDEEATEEKQ